MVLRDSEEHPLESYSNSNSLSQRNSATFPRSSGLPLGLTKRLVGRGGGGGSNTNTIGAASSSSGKGMGARNVSLRNLLFPATKKG
jgi:hypothetical protein